MDRLGSGLCLMGRMGSGLWVSASVPKILCVVDQLGSGLCLVGRMGSGLRESASFQNEFPVSWIG